MMKTTTPTCQSTDLAEAISRLDAQINILEKQWGNNQSPKEYAILTELTEAREIMRRNLAEQQARAGRHYLGESARLLGLAVPTLMNYIFYNPDIPQHVDENGDFYLLDEEIEAYKKQQAANPRRRKHAK